MDQSHTANFPAMTEIIHPDAPPRRRRIATPLTPKNRKSSGCPAQIVDDLCDSFIPDPTSMLRSASPGTPPLREDQTTTGDADS
jgi:hypothetical protein